MVKAKSAGQFLGGILNNPFVAILLLGIGALLIFREPILRGFTSIGEGFGKIELPDITLPTINLPEIKFPEFPEITFPEFPEFKFPEFKFPDFFGGGDELEQPLKMVEDTGLLEDPTVCKCGSSIVQDAFGNVNQTCKACPTDTALPSQDPALNVPVLPAGMLGGIFGGITQFLGLTPAQAFAVEEKDVSVQSFLPDQPTQQFEGGGVSFIGGSIFETPIENLSLNQIINMGLASTASEAANLKAIAQGFTKEEEEFLQGSGDIGGFFTGFNPPAVSDQQFAGLTPQQIALQLTGGNISNF